MSDSTESLVHVDNHPVDDQSTPLFPPNKRPSGSFLVRNTAFVQAHTTLDKAPILQSPSFSVSIGGWSFSRNPANPVVQNRGVMMKKSYLPILVGLCAFVCASVPAVAGVGIHLNALRAVNDQGPADDEVKIDEYNWDNNTGAFDLSKAHSQGNWVTRPTDAGKVEVKYAESKSEEGAKLHRYFAVNLATQEQPVCLIEITGDIYYFRGPRIKMDINKDLVMTKTKFGEDSNVLCKLRSTEWDQPHFDGDTLHINFDVGYSASPNSPLSPRVSKRNARKGILGDVQGGSFNPSFKATYKFTCDNEPPSDKEHTTDHIFDIHLEYRKDPPVPGYFVFSKSRDNSLIYRLKTPLVHSVGKSRPVPDVWLEAYLALESASDFCKKVDGYPSPGSVKSVDSQ